MGVFSEFSDWSPMQQMAEVRFGIGTRSNLAGAAEAERDDSGQNSWCCKSSPWSAWRRAAKGDEPICCPLPGSLHEACHV